MSTIENKDTPPTEPTPATKAVEKKTEAKPQPKADPPPLTSLSIIDKKLKCFERQECYLKFSRMDPIFEVYEHTLNINNQDTMPRAVYEKLQEIVSYTLPITLVQFTQMWKTLILKRVQDIYESEKSRRSDHYIRLVRNILLPAPLGDLLHSLGHYYSASMGMSHHLVPPSRASTPEDFWTVSTAIVAAWNQTMKQIEPFYTIKEYPSMTQCEDRPMLLTRVSNFATPMRSVNAFTKEPKMTDAFVHSLQDELFIDHPFITFDNCHLIMTNSINSVQIRRDYVKSYVITHNS